MSFRAFSIGFSAALLALACGSEDGNQGGDDTPIDVPEPPSGEDFCRDNPLAEDCDDTPGGGIGQGGEEPPGEEPPGETEEPPNEGDLELAAVQGILADNCGACH